MKLTKLMKPAFYLLIILACLFLQACPDRYDPEPDFHFTIINDTNERIYFFMKHADTIITPKISSAPPLMYIEPMDSLIQPEWSELYTNQRKLNIIIFKASTIKKYPWQEIQEKDIVDKRFVLTLDDLKAMNYKIVFDGD